MSSVELNFVLLCSNKQKLLKITILYRASVFLDCLNLISHQITFVKDQKKIIGNVMKQENVQFMYKRCNVYLEHELNAWHIFQ